MGAIVARYSASSRAVPLWASGLSACEKSTISRWGRCRAAIPARVFEEGCGEGEVSRGDYAGVRGAGGRVEVAVVGRAQPRRADDHADTRLEGGQRMSLHRRRVRVVDPDVGVLDQGRCGVGRDRDSSRSLVADGGAHVPARRLARQPGHETQVLRPQHRPGDGAARPSGHARDADARGHEMLDGASGPCIDPCTCSGGIPAGS